MFLQILSYITDQARRLADLKNIFFLNAKTQFNNEDDRQIFFNKYAEIYFKTWPDDTFFACDLTTQNTLGYLIGCRDSLKAQTLLSENLKSYTVFADLFKKYPAHLHMNTHPNHTGQGVGSFMLLEYIIELKKFNVKGVHVVTSPDEKNVQFYLKHKFTDTVEREFNGRKLLFMGLVL